MDYYIVENSLFARIGRIILKAPAVAMVIGKGIHLSGVCKEDFLRDERWLKHELVHIQQYKEHGTFKFLCKYLAESFKKGYYNNKYEVEARAKSSCGKTSGGNKK